MRYVFSGPLTAADGRPELLRTEATPARFSEETTRAVLRACAAGDIVRLRELVDLAALEDAPAAERLRLLSENFDYRAITRWLGAG